MQSFACKIRVSCVWVATGWPRLIGCLISPLTMLHPRWDSTTIIWQIPLRMLHPRWYSPNITRQIPQKMLHPRWDSTNIIRQIPLKMLHPRIPPHENKLNFSVQIQISFCLCFRAQRSESTEISAVCKRAENAAKHWRTLILKILRQSGRSRGFLFWLRSFYSW